MKNKRRKICVVVASRANYARIKYFLKAVKESDRLELQLIVGASALLYKFGRAVDVMMADGFKPDWRIHYLVEGENLTTQAKSTGMGIIELSTAFGELAPDVVLTVADRYETMATAIASSYLNIPLAHVQGGEVSGNIDDSVRHAITKLAHYHFPSTQQSAERIMKMGEDPSRVFMTGCPSIDILANMGRDPLTNEYFRERGTGRPFLPRKKYIMMVQHPVTTSFGAGAEQVSETLKALESIPMQKILLWPNADAGSDDVSKMIREFHERHRNGDFSYHINFSPEIYAKLLAGAECLVGNSSSFIREGSFLGTPAVIVGDRQEGREHGRNVVLSGYDAHEIRAKVKAQIKHGPYESETIFGDGQAGKRIAGHLEKVDLYLKKKYTY
ncbi:MAG: UDP-N-acetylglucosamine 2-epimerase (hydrolyzing) [Candidatus Omnitrophica bacterium]|nr:UDP-N-acetylglucosamine 2-epimerase (hydrolyzing) [Candidatus Omnitrophota bacterium]